MPEDMTATDTVGDDETLYRRVPRNREGSPPYYNRSGGHLQVLAQAFSERPVPDGEPFAGQYRLSVDRAKSRGFRPELTQQAATFGDPASYAVVCMPAHAVRGVSQVEDIVPDPIRDEPGQPDNPAHALICIRYDPGQSKTANKNAYKEAIAELADLANRTPWPIEPPD